MVVGVVCTMIIVLWVVLAVCNFSPRTAYTVLQHSQHLFEPDDQALEELPKVAVAARLPRRRPYITPLLKKRVAANQKWRCASCERLLDETHELDHIKPLFRGGTNLESNLQALCKRCHAMKSALEQSSRR